MRIESIDNGFRLADGGLSVAIELAHNEDGDVVGFLVTSGIPMAVIPESNHQIQIQLLNP